MDIQLSQQHSLKGLFFLHWIVLALLSKVNCHEGMGLFLDPHFYSVDSYICLYANIILSRLLKSLKFKFFFIMIVLAINEEWCQYHSNMRCPHFCLLYPTTELQHLSMSKNILGGCGIQHCIPRNVVEVLLICALGNRQTELSPGCGPCSDPRTSSSPSPLLSGCPWRTLT